MDQMFADYPRIIVSGEAARLAYNGNGIKDRDVRKDENILDEAYVRVYDDVEDVYKRQQQSASSSML